MDSLPPEGPGFFYELIKRRLKKQIGSLVSEFSAGDGDRRTLDNKIESRGVDVLKNGQQDAA